MSQTWQDIDTGAGGDTPKTAWPKATARFDTLRSNFEGSTTPTTAVDGQNWHDSTAPSDPVIKHYYDGAWNEHFIPYTARSTIDVSNNQIKNFRVDNTSTTENSTATTDGMLWYNVNNGYLELDDNSGSGTVVPVHSGLVTFQKTLIASTGATAPTATTVGTSPGVDGYHMDAIGESLKVRGTVPHSWVANDDLTLTLRCALPNTETANDEIKFNLDYIVATHNNDELLTKTSTTASVQFDIGANTTQWSVHSVDITLDYNDATNPIAVGDTFAGEFNLITTEDLTNGIIVYDWYLVGSRNK